jgi:tetratricopeptide (TPR) repeat protein
MSGNTKAPPELLAYLRQLRGAALAAAGKRPQAILAFEQEIAAAPNEINSYLQLSQIFLDERRFDEASAVLDRAARKLGADEPELLFMRAVIHERAGRYDEALELLEGLIEHDPDHHLALNFAGYTLAELGRDLPRARTYVERALELEPNQGSYLDSLGWVLYRQGEYAEAEKYLLQAQKTKYRDPVIREHLGFVFRALNRDREALAEFQAALDFDLASEKPVDEVRRQITELRSILDLNQ